MTTSVLSVWMPSVGWVSCTGSFILQIPLVSTNSINPLFSQPWTIVQVSGIPAQHFILINWILYRTLPLKLLQNSRTLPMMIAWDSWTYPVCLLAARDRNFPSATELWQADPLYLLGSLHPTCVLTCVITTTCHYTIQVSELLSTNPLFQSVLFHSGTLYRDLVSSPSCDSFKARLSLMCL